MSEPSLATVEKLYQNRGLRAVELKTEGIKTMGYLCCYAPTELLTAAGVVPLRITGNVNESISMADAHIETITCPFVRNCFDLALRGEYSFLDGFVVPHTCDNVARIYDIWRYTIRQPYNHFINVPHTIATGSLDFFRAELDTFKKSLETSLDKHISSDELRESIALHNQFRGLVRKLYDLRLPDPPLLSGAETMKIILATTRLPVNEANELLRSAIEEIKQRPNKQPKGHTRILVYGPEVDDVPFIEMIEEMGFDVVIDDLCIGTRPYWSDVEITPDPMDGLAQRYLEKINCPRTFRPRTGTRKEDLDNRFKYILDFAKKYRVKGIILYVIKYCDIYGFDAVDVKDYMEEAGFPGIIVEGDYTSMSIDWMKTRIQAFQEMIA
ncbi:MAG: 2-hydroxyacyl-CoA dehydratase family protein [Chloroflexota bacterium]|nr:2-hydroxyacyl-CoA dehydratase family protein [Chloroflexota bacterium]